MDNNEVARMLADIISDEIGQRLHHNPDEVGEVTDWYSTENAAVFRLADGRCAVLTVVVDGGAA